MSNDAQQIRDRRIAQRTIILEDPAVPIATKQEAHARQSELAAGEGGEEA